MTSTKKLRRSRDPDRTKANIIKEAGEEFAARGMYGARLDAIAARTRTTKRMIYYYFGGGAARNSAKAQLFTATLEQLYSEIQSVESQLDLDTLAPSLAIGRLVDFYFDYCDAQPQFIRLVITENIHEARHLRKSKAIKEFRTGIIDKIGEVLQRGLASGEFRASIDPIDLLLLILGQSFYRAANHYTFEAVYHCDLTTPLAKAQQKALLRKIVLAYLRSPPGNEDGVEGNLGRNAIATRAEPSAAATARK
jgi:AcrR family transcriptional regulator